MKKTLFSIALICISFFGISQSGLTNLSFESWNNFGMTPTGFLSMGATQMNSNAQHLSKFVRLTSNGQSSSANGSGGMQLGSLNGSALVDGAPYTLRPFSLTGYYKCNLINSDTVYIAANLTKNGVSILASGTSANMRIVSSESNWTPFTITFTYANVSDPDSIHIYMTANKALGGFPAGSSGTTLDLDNFALNVNMTGLHNYNQWSPEISAYPNPANEEVTITSEQATKVAIYDLRGKLISIQNFGENKVIISLKDYEPGVYIYKLLDVQNQLIKAKKLIINK